MRIFLLYDADTMSLKTSLTSQDLDAICDIVVGAINESFKQLSVPRFDGLEDRMDGLEVRMNRLEGRFDSHDADIDTLKNDVTALYRLTAKR